MNTKLLYYHQWYQVNLPTINIQTLLGFLVYEWHAVSKIAGGTDLHHSEYNDNGRIAILMHQNNAVAVIITMPEEEDAYGMRFKQTLQTKVNGPLEDWESQELRAELHRTFNQVMAALPSKIRIVKQESQ